nr:NlpC/P60 family protein [Arthrobacter sp. zg-Y919]
MAATQAAAAKTAAAARVAPAAAASNITTASNGGAADAQAPVSGNVAAGLVASAYAQIGVAQDCTAMVEKALRSVGKSVGDLAPGQFYQFGSVVGSPAPGDLVISATHVAIYVGNGQVVSGGLNGMNTGLHALSDLRGVSFVRVS